MLILQAVGESHVDSAVTLPLAENLQFSLACMVKNRMKEDCMRWSNRFGAVLLILGFFTAVAARAQSQTSEIGPLPTALTTEQLQLTPRLSPVAPPEHPQPRARRRLPKPVLPLTPEEISYREAVRKLGVHKHRFVHCELPNEKVRTGVITSIRDDGFTLKDGILIAQWIPYTDLKAAPRPVAAVGTRIGQGLKWTGLVAGCIAAVPLVVVMLPFVFTGVLTD
jgi:hypothetical protein